MLLGRRRVLLGRRRRVVGAVIGHVEPKRERVRPVRQFVLDIGTTAIGTGNAVHKVPEDGEIPGEARILEESCFEFARGQWIEFVHEELGQKEGVVDSEAAADLNWGRFQRDINERAIDNQISLDEGACSIQTKARLRNLIA